MNKVKIDIETKRDLLFKVLKINTNSDRFVLYYKGLDFESFFELEGNKQELKTYLNQKFIDIFQQTDLTDYPQVSDQETLKKYYGIVKDAIENQIAIKLSNLFSGFLGPHFSQGNKRNQFNIYDHLCLNLSEYSSLLEVLDLEENKLLSINKCAKLYYNVSTKGKSLSSEISEEKISRNQILYGPPGTGKTYITINKALEIINGKEYLEGKSRKELQREFNSLKDKGQIQFTTFHQSFSYEDFVEGIRPIPPGKGGNESDQLIYDVESGIFKSLCESAMGEKVESNTEVSVEVSKARYYKMSLGGRQNQELHDWCIENDYVALGYGGNHDYSGLKDNRDWNSFKKHFNENYPDLVEKSRYNIQAVYAFLGMKKGDIVMATLGNHIVDAIGVIDSDYEWSDDKAIDFSQFRRVKWLATNLKAQPEKFVRKKISQQTIYEFYNADIKKEAFEDLLSIESKEEQNYVLIIDEINRGNVASIFGELITLLEPDKRLGRENELRVSLPYSRETFGVPSNLHIIGTMNTADRSVEALDTALRRRFSFMEMMCDYTVLDQVIGHDFEVNGIVIKQMLKTINERLELLLNRDHQIGHAWFLSLKDAEIKQKELNNIFQNKILPLLQEFFYADYGKIGLVLGNGFVEVQIAKNGHKPFASFDYENEAFEEQKLYKIRKEIDWELVSKEFGKMRTAVEETQDSIREKETVNA